ncbi:MAG: M13-type metalloendopeptidase [Cytophagales bacterium]|nr:M13-type metalloendopeptidase [Cytophagales bacterium]
MNKVTLKLPIAGLALMRIFAAGACTQAPDAKHSMARIWRVKTTDQFLRMYVNTEPATHTHLPKWRVNGPLMNFIPFYTAFNVQPGMECINQKVKGLWFGRSN